MSDDNEVEQEEVQPFSKIFPTEVKYESSTGEITSVWVKQAEVVFVNGVDEDGEADGSLMIQLIIENTQRDVVLHKYVTTEA